MRTTDITPDDRGSHTTVTINLHPSMVSSSNPIELSCEVFDGIRPFCLSMHQDIQPSFFLDTNCLLDLTLLREEGENKG